MDGWWCDLKVPQHVGFGWCFFHHACVGVYEGKILPLLYCEFKFTRSAVGISHMFINDLLFISLDLKHERL